MSFGAFLVHKSAPNLSNENRRGLLLSYQPPGAPDMRDLLRASYISVRTDGGAVVDDPEAGTT